MKRLNKSGFGAIETILILVILGIIAIVSWHVWQSHTARPAKTSTSTTQNVSSSAGWKNYQWTAEGLSFKYPSSWLTINPQAPAKDQANLQLPTKPKDPYVYLSSPIVLTENGFAAGSTPPISTFTGAFAVNAIKDAAENIEISTDAGRPHGIPAFVYILKVIPFNVPGYRQLWIIEEGEQGSSYVDELAITDIPVKVGLSTSSDDDSFQSKSNSKDRISFTLGLYSQQQNDQTYSFINMPVNTFEQLQDYDIALTIMKSISY